MLVHEKAWSGMMRAALRVDPVHRSVKFSPHFLARPWISCLLLVMLPFRERIWHWPALCCTHCRRFCVT